MFHKYLISIAIFTILVQSSPKLFESYGNKMETFQDDCSAYQNDKRIPTQIKKKCRIYISHTGKAFKYGYKLDPYVDSDNINLDKVEKYNIYLHNLEEEKDNILSLVYQEAKKARDKNNIDYYKLLIENDQMILYVSDYAFMEEHKEQFKEHSQYLRHKKKMDDQEKIRLKRERKERIDKLENEKSRKLSSKLSVITCSALRDKILNNYTKSLTHVKNGMSVKANNLYQITLNEKSIFISKCANSKEKELIEKGLIDADRILKINQYNLNVHSESPLIKAQIIEKDIDRINRKYEREMAEIARDRKKTNDNLNRRIKELESKI